MLRGRPAWGDRARTLTASRSEEPSVTFVGPASLSSTERRGWSVSCFKSAHIDESRDALDAGLGLLRRLDAVQDRVAVRAVERIEEGSRACIPRECGSEVHGQHLEVRAPSYALSHRPSRFARSTSASPGASIFPDAIRASAFARLILTKGSSARAVRSVAATKRRRTCSSARRSSPRRERPRAPLGRSVTSSSPLLRELQPHAARRSVMPLQPSGPGARRGERDRRQVLGLGHGPCLAASKVGRLEKMRQDTGKGGPRRAARSSATS